MTVIGSDEEIRALKERVTQLENMRDLLAASLKKQDDDIRKLNAKLDLAVRECDRLLDQLIESRNENDRLRSALDAFGGRGP